MSDSAPTRPVFDRAAALILGSMITLIAVLALILVETSVESDPDKLPVAASIAERPATP
jgi:hypothetical protein